MAFAIDGTNSATTGFEAQGTLSIAAALTTSNSCVIWAAVQNAGGAHSSTTASTITDNSGLGLTWVQRAGKIAGFGNGYTELWSAVSPQALSAVTITATFATQTENGAIIVFGTDGANTVSLLDPNGSLPIQENSTSSPLTVTLSTTNAPDFGLLVVGEVNSPITGVTGGWTLLEDAPISDGFDDNSDLRVYYQQFPGQQTGLASAISTNSSQAVAGLAVALNAAAAPTVTRARCVMVGF